MKNVLLLNLGSPKSTDKQHVREYLEEFMSDDYVLDFPKFFQQLILRLFILPFRPSQAKEAYEEIWEEDGSPLIINTQKIADALSKQTGWDVDIAMRYQYPSIEESILRFKEKRIKELHVIPLYPHNASSTTVSTNEEVKKVVKKIYPELQLKFIEPFYNHPDYIDSLAKSIKPHMDGLDKLIFSYHGIPIRHVTQSCDGGKQCYEHDNCCSTDSKEYCKCYKCNTYMTSKFTADKLNLSNSDWKMTYQSRVSVVSPYWLKPYTDKELENFPNNGVENIGIVCPSFVADCLETLEEIGMRGKESFMESGGKSFTYIPCLNDNKHFISALEKIISPH